MFLKLTWADPDRGGPLWINMDHVIEMAVDDGTNLWTVLNPDPGYCVSETPEQIFEMMKVGG